MIIKEKSIKSYVVLEKTLRYILSKNNENENFVFRKIHIFFNNPKANLKKKKI